MVSFNMLYAQMSKFNSILFQFTTINNYSPLSPTLRWITVLVYTTQAEIPSGPKSNIICDNIPTKAILFFLGCSEVNSTWLIAYELANQRAWKELFTCVVYTNPGYIHFWIHDFLLSDWPAQNQNKTTLIGSHKTKTKQEWPRGTGTSYRASGKVLRSGHI